MFTRLTRTRRSALFAAASALLCSLTVATGDEVAQAAPPDRAPTVVYLVEHGEPVFTDPAMPLSDNGIRYAKAVAAVLKDVTFTNIYSSPALRSKQTVSYAADARGMAVQQLPNADPKTPSADAAAPLADAVSKLPAGSVALVGGNTENIYRIMNTLGIPVQAGCRPGQRCVPCLDKTCFTPNDLSTVWQLTLYPQSSGFPPGMGLVSGMQRIHPETQNVFNPPTPK
ncbi:histidine phosphatase family protein [Mycobacterium sp. HM-7]